MNKTKYTEQQIEFALRQAHEWPRCSVKWAFLKRPFTTGRRSMAALVFLSSSLKTVGRGEPALETDGSRFESR